MAEDIEILDRENGGVSDFINILEHGKELYQEIKRSMFSASFVEAEHLNMQTEQFVTTIVISFGHLRNTLLQDANMIETIATLIYMFQCLVRRLMDRFETSVYDDLQYNCPNNVCSEGRGRPQLLIPKEQLEGLRSLGFSWKTVATMLGVSEKTIMRRRDAYGIQSTSNKYMEVSDDQLDDIVKAALSASPNSGERMVLGYIRAQRFFVQRWRVRQSIWRIDPDSRMLRCRKITKRRLYNVPTPNSLW